jgi:flagellar protein FlgJ
MEITGSGTINVEDYRPSSAVSLQIHKNFAEILERTRLADESLQESSRGDVPEPGVFRSAETRKISASSRTAPIDKTDKLYQLCLELETFLVKNILTGMRNTVQKSGLIDDSFAGKMYEDMLYDEYAKDYTKNANFGLAEMAYRQLKT